MITKAIKTVNAKKKLKPQTFAQGSAVLIISVVAAKIISALFKIPLTNILGGTGMGYFSSAYGLFLPIYAVSTIGLTTAVAKLTADNAALGRYDNAKRIRNVSLAVFSIMGLIGSLLIIALAKPFAVHAVSSPNSYAAIIMLAPSVLFGCVSAVYRGYYEGLRNMSPTAWSQVFEAFVKLIAGLGLCKLAVSKSELFSSHFPALFPRDDVSVIAAAAAVLGVTISCLAGTLFTIFKYHRSAAQILTKRGNSLNMNIYRDTDRKRLIIRDLIRVLIPVSLAALVTNLTSLIDLFTIVRGLDKAVEKSPELFGALVPAEEFADFAFGAFLGLSVTIFNLIPAVTNMFGKSVFPLIADSYAKKDKNSLKKHIDDVLFTTAFVSIPGGLGIFILAKQILYFLYPSRLAEVEVAYESLSYLGIGVILCCLTFPMFSVFQALGRADLPLKLMLAGVAIKLGANLLLISVPKYNISGAAIGTVVSYGVILILALLKLNRVTEVKVSYSKIFAAPFYAGILCSATALLVYGFVHELPVVFALPLSAAGGGAVYLLSAWLMSLPIKRVKNI